MESIWLKERTYSHKLPLASTHVLCHVPLTLINNVRSLEGHVQTRVLHVCDSVLGRQMQVGHESSLAPQPSQTGELWAL